MRFSTYAELKAAIADELNRTDLVDSIEGFIALSESQTGRQLRTRQMLETTTLTVNAELVPLPANFLEARSLLLLSNPPTALQFRTIDSMAMYKAANNFKGKPTEYTVLGGNFQFLKAPDAAYDATVVYYRTIPALSDAAPTNWLLEKAPDIYFYGALINSAPYLKEDSRIQTWATYYQGAVDALQTEDDRSQTAASGLKAKARQF